MPAQLAALAPTIFAHLGHWYVGLPVYCGPLVLLVLWIKLGALRDKRRRAQEAAGRRPAGASPS